MPRRPLFLVCALLPLAACLHPSPAPAVPAPCGKDTDCKGDRICEAGRCTSPAQQHQAAPLAAAPAADAGVELAAVAPPPPTVTLPGASPGFHGDWTHRGQSRYTVSRTPPRVVGRYRTGGTVYGSPALTDEGVAIFGSHDRDVYAVAVDPKQPHGVDLRWKRATGDLVWCSPALGPAPTRPVALARLDGGVDGGGDGAVTTFDAGANPDAGATTAVAAGTAAPTVYIGSDDDHLYALDAATGAVRWTFPAGPCERQTGVGPEASRCDVDGVTVGPDGTIYLVADGAYALRPDGSLKWSYRLATHCASAPAVAADGTVLFGCQDDRLHALAPDGTPRWDYPTAGDIDSSVAIAADGALYFGSDDGKLYSLTSSGTLRWALTTGGRVHASPAIAADGTVYVGSYDGKLYAVAPTGQVAWTFATADRIVSSPTLDAAGTILFGSEDDRLYALAPDGKLLWSVLLGGDVDSTPALGPGGLIYVGSDDQALHVLK